MLSNLLNKTCDVFTTSLDETWSSALLVEVATYTGISCYFELISKSENLKSTTTSDATDVDRFEVVLDFSNRNIKTQDIVELYDIDWDSQWKFKVDHIQKAKWLLGDVDHVYIIVTRYAAV
jgi:hypothetical protein